ncbi:hypothetical protein [Nocardia sp. NPDC004722]
MSMETNPRNAIQPDPVEERNQTPLPSTPQAHPDQGETVAKPGNGQLSEHWREVQIRFVDDPKDAVTRADALVADALTQLTDRFSRRREELESRWARGDAADTEEMRQALRGYRELFDQLVGGTASGAMNM